MITKLFKGIIVLLLLLTFLRMPYGYYTLLKWIVTGFSIYFAYAYWNLKEKGWALTFLIIAMIFNPIFIVAFGKQIWKIVDVIVAIYYLITIFKLDKR